MIIPIKTSKEIEIMNEGGKILARIMQELEQAVRPGITTKKLDEIARYLISKYKTRSAFLNYKDPSKKNVKPFPAVLCVSLNKVIVHGIPNNRILKEGDIISLDLGIIWKGFCTDMAITIPVGRVDPETLRIIQVTKKALKKGIKEIRPNNTMGDIGNVIQKYVESQGFSVVRDLCGHGIGRKIHENPPVFNYGKKKTGYKLAEGMTFCLEPMITAGDWRIKKAKDGYGWETYDGSLSCHFEHTVAVKSNGCVILTKI